MVECADVVEPLGDTRDDASLARRSASVVLTRLQSTRRRGRMEDDEEDPVDLPRKTL